MTKFRLPPPRMFLSAFAVAFFGTVPYSYQSVLNQPASIIKEFVRASFYSHYGKILSSGELNALWGFICASICLGSGVGAALFNKTSEKFGRRNGALVVNSCVVMLGALIQSLSKSVNAFELLIVGRFITGISVALTIICSVYLSESAPDYCRGFCSVMVSLMFGFWSMMVTAFGLPSILGSDELWPVLLAYGIPFAICSIILSRFVPESPKYLSLHMHKREEAWKSIQFFHGSDVDVEGILEEFHREEEVAQTQRDFTYKEIFREKHLSRPFWITMLVYCCCVFVGIDVAYQYSNDVLQSVGLNEQNAALAVVLTQIPAILSSCFAMYLVEKLGRRDLMFLTLTVAIIGFIFFMMSSLTTVLALIALILIFCSHHGGASPERDIIAGDVCPQGIRSKSAGCANMVGFSGSFFVVVAFPPLEDIIGTYTFLILLVPCVLSFAWFCKFMPETTQLPVDETVHKWMNLEEDKRSEESHAIF